MAAVNPSESLTCDLLVIGSGAGGMSAAVTAACLGLKVIVVEKEAHFGGATARSGGWLWIPGNRLAKEAGISDSREQAEIYMQKDAPETRHADKVDAYLTKGPEMVDFMEANTPVKFNLLAGYPDYYPDLPGGTKGGRSIFPKDYDGAQLGEDLARLRPTLAVGTVFGMQIGTSDARYFMTAGRKMSSLLYVLKCIAVRLRDQIRAGRSLRLVGGNALIAGLTCEALKRGVTLITSAAARSLCREDGRVTGAVVETGGKLIRIEAGRGVVLATGGFPHDSKLRAELFPAGAVAPEVWGMMPYGNSGDGIRLGRSVGGRLSDYMKSTVALSPLSRVHGAEGVLQTFPMFSNRGAPGVIAVTRNGKRFVNEGRSYHEFGVALLAATKGEPEAVAWFVCDHRALRRYGLGYVPPAPAPFARHVRSGYLIIGQTIAELARAAGIDPMGLQSTLDTFNQHARTAADPEFHRGSNYYDMVNGDPDHKPSPCLAPLEKGPFYAVRVFVGSVGTFAGLVTDGSANVLREDGSVIEGLYAAGNDLASITRGDYLAGGCTIGPAMTFGYIAARHAHANNAEKPTSSSNTFDADSRPTLRTAEA